MVELHTNVRDLARFAKALTAKALTAKALTAKALTTTAEDIIRPES